MRLRFSVKCEPHNGENMIRAFLKFYFSRTLLNWRLLRRACIKVLPKIDRKLEGSQ